MADRKRKFTPVKYPRGKRVHVLELGRDRMETSCGRPFKSGWIASLDLVNCRRCKLRVALSCSRGKAKR